MFGILLDRHVHSHKEVAQGIYESHQLSTMSSLGLIHYPNDAADAKNKLVHLTNI
jgi:hypothetical protein